jgi:hypothetical protein
MVVPNAGLTSPAFSLDSLSPPSSAPSIRRNKIDSPSLPLLMSQYNHRIDAQRAPRRDVTCKQSNNDE